MNRNCQTIKFSNRDPDFRDASQLVLLPRWASMLALLRSTTTLAALAILATTGLMLAFHQVVLGAVAQGESLQQARNQRSAALSRCTGLQGTTERADCLRHVHSKDSTEARR